MKRDEALQILSKDGMLLVLCSLIDNMPYVVAEAAVRLLLTALCSMADKATRRPAECTCCAGS